MPTKWKMWKISSGRESIYLGKAKNYGSVDGGIAQNSSPKVVPNKTNKIKKKNFKRFSL